MIGYFGISGRYGEKGEDVKECEVAEILGVDRLKVVNTYENLSTVNPYQ